MKVLANLGKIQQDTCPVIDKNLKFQKHLTYSPFKIFTSENLLSSFQRDTLLLTLKLAFT